MDQRTLLKKIVAEHGGICTLYDTETSGLGKADMPIQVAAYRLKIDTSACRADVLAKANWFVKPPFMVSRFIEEFTGITNGFLRTCPDADGIIDEILEFFGSHPVVGYNTAFDNGMMERLCEWADRRWEPKTTVDVLCMAKEFTKKGREVPDHKQATIARYYGVDHGLKFHDARGDIEACRRLLETFMRLYQ